MSRLLSKTHQNMQFIIVCIKWDSRNSGFMITVTVDEAVNIMKKRRITKMIFTIAGAGNNQGVLILDKRIISPVRIPVRFEIGHREDGDLTK